MHRTGLANPFTVEQILDSSPRPDPHTPLSGFLDELAKVPTPAPPAPRHQ
jgi:hypothetical protein